MPDSNYKSNFIDFQVGKSMPYVSFFFSMEPAKRRISRVRIFKENRTKASLMHPKDGFYCLSERYKLPSLICIVFNYIYYIPIKTSESQKGLQDGNFSGRQSADHRGTYLPGAHSQWTHARGVCPVSWRLPTGRNRLRTRGRG